MKKLLALVLTLALCLTLVAGAASAEATGKVYYLNFKPEADEAWQALAKTYTEQTGVPVTVVTAASGTYSEVLTAEMDKGDAAPTLFQCGNQAGLETWADYLLPLQDTDFYKELSTEEFNLYGENGDALAVGYCYEAFGIITNKALLEEAGYSVDDITNFETLKAVAEDIHARSAELGFDAFTSSGMDGSSSWRFSGHLANMPLYYEFRDDGITSQPATIKGTYLDNFKQIWDLYINNCATDPSQLASATGDQALAEFGEGKAVFYQNGTWAYADCIAEGLTDDDLGMLPIYIGVDGEEQQGLCTGSENFWCINKNAKPENIEATKAFLEWVITSDEGRDALANQMGFVTPFTTFDAGYTAHNALLDAASEDLAVGHTPVSWTFPTMPSEAWKNGVGAALLEYAQGTKEWSAVETAFVDGWASEYAAAKK